MGETTELTETTPALIYALKEKTGRPSFPLHTGGGVMVAVIDLDGSKQVWLTREEGWLLGFYDFGQDDCDEGVCVNLVIPSRDLDDPVTVAEAVAGILRRVRG